MGISTQTTLAALGVMAALLGGCARHNWVPGPTASIQDFDQQRAQCSLAARHANQGGFYAAGSPNFVAGAAIGNAVGQGVRTQQDFNDCMLATGWKIAQ